MLPWPILEYQQNNATTTRAIATTTTTNQQEQHEIQCCLFTIDFVFKICRMALKYEKNKQQNIKKNSIKWKFCVEAVTSSQMAEYQI